MTAGFREFVPVCRGVAPGRLPFVYRRGKRAVMNRAARALVGIAPAGRYRLYVDREGGRVGFWADPRGPLTWPKKCEHCAALRHALDEIGAPSECALLVEAVDLPPVTHCVRLSPR